MAEAASSEGEMVGLPSDVGVATGLIFGERAEGEDVSEAKLDGVPMPLRWVSLVNLRQWLTAATKMEQTSPVVTLGA